MKAIVALFALAVAVNAGVIQDSEPVAELKDITFTLYLKKHDGNGVQMFLGDKESIKKAGFDPKLPVRVGTHAYMCDACGNAVQGLRKAFHAQGDCNYISIDWSKFAKTLPYEKAALQTKAIGTHISKFLRFLRDETKFDIKQMHLVGHCMGAQILSFASDEFPGEKVGRITGNDPAGPIFHNIPNNLRLDPSDAIFVDVLHTDTVFMGIRQPIGTVDFYVNGGKQQPGCKKDDFACNHDMSHRFFTYTVKNKKDYTAVQCKDLKEAEEGKCSGDKAPMGIGATTAKPGIYYAKIEKAPEA
ncbi:UNVERIFIED_CONTAM: hypothetical protein PYX00_001963 [Menopon gallinae]|uniref:Lipase domain-containing protein n=1 Tax=Menopon gallinae TaxID=328185 RepID=A0AAW2IF35_9NEOP